MTPLQYGATKIAQLAEEAIGRGFLFAGHMMPAGINARIEFKAIADSPGILPYPFAVGALDGAVVMLAGPDDVAALWGAMCTHVVLCRSKQALFAGLLYAGKGTQEEVDAVVIEAIRWARE